MALPKKLGVQPWALGFLTDSHSRDITVMTSRARGLYLQLTLIISQELLCQILHLSDVAFQIKTAGSVCKARRVRHNGACGKVSRVDKVDGGVL